MSTPQTLIKEIEARGASIRADEGALKVANDDALTDALRGEIRAHKAELLALLQHGNPFADQAEPEPQPAQLPEPAPFIPANAFVFVPANPKSVAQARHAFEVQLAREILSGAYFNQRDGEWCIGWATKGRHAWQRLCLDMGGELEESGLPSMSAAAAIEWAKSRSETQNSASDSEEVQPMAQPKRICVKRGQAFPDKNTKSVKRPTKWGNPFLTGIGKSDSPEVQLEKRRAAVEEFEKWLEGTPEGQAIVEAAPRELRGWNLACACPEDGGPCHGAVLLRLANAAEVSR